MTKTRKPAADPVPLSSDRVFDVMPDMVPMTGSSTVFWNRKLVLKKQSAVAGYEVDGVTLPTLHLDGGWVLQPRCERKNLEQAVATLTARLHAAGHALGNFDLVTENVGWWRGEPYLFDW